MKKKIALITGASGGIGGACAETLARAGYTVLLHGCHGLEHAKALAELCIRDRPSRTPEPKPMNKHLFAGIEDVYKRQVESFALMENAMNSATISVTGARVQICRII